MNDHLDTPRQDTGDFLAAFAIGAVLGIGATLLLQPRRTPSQRIARQIKPYRKQMRRSYGHAREAVSGSADATADLTGEIAAAAAALLAEFRGELAELVEGAQSEVRSTVRDQRKSLRKGVRKTRRKFGI